jgi:acetylglutamate kinase
MQKLIAKADILIEALPYIRKFRGKEIIVKYGGSAMKTQETTDDVLQGLAFLHFVGIRPILVHGGGGAITANLKKAGVQTQFKEGHRVTDAASIRIVEETLEGINKDIVHELGQLGARSIGIGHGNEILKVKKKLIKGIDFGFVGEVESVNVPALKALTDSDIIPVVYPVGIDGEGQLFNVNADEAAAKIAVQMNVSKIVFLTNVPGILKDSQKPESLISSISLEEVEAMIKSGAISGGMIPKVTGALLALHGGVKKAHIIDGRIKNSILLEIFTASGIGTEIYLEKENQ